MNRAWREYFDEQLELVIPELPQRVRDLLDDVTMIVEDYPAPELMEKMGIEYRDDLQGLYVGTELPDRSIELSGNHTDTIYLFREGIASLAEDEGGEVSDEELRKQIRITILHEFGHLHGLDEDDLADLGYE